jgi:acetyl esterase/lipase
LEVQLPCASGCGVSILVDSSSGVLRVASKDEMTFVLKKLCAGYCQKLETFNIDPYNITVSGISSGAAFATQFHVAFSKQATLYY